MVEVLTDLSTVFVDNNKIEIEKKLTLYSVWVRYPLDPHFFYYFNFGGKMAYKLFAARLEANILGWEQNCWVWVENEEDPEDQVQFLVSKNGEILDSEDMEVVPEYLVELVRKAAIAEYQKQEKNK